MHVIGPEPPDAGDEAVHTIDIWYSRTRRRWVLQRHGGHGEPIGPPHVCRTEAEADACLADWRRRHPETYLAAVREKPIRRKTAT